MRALRIREAGRVVITHDVSTMTRHAYERADTGQRMPGVIEVSPNLEVARVVDDLVLVARASIDGEWEGRVLYLPLR